MSCCVCGDFCTCGIQPQGRQTVPNTDYQRRRFSRITRLGRCIVPNSNYYCPTRVYHRPICWNPCPVCTPPVSTEAVVAAIAIITLIGIAAIAIGFDGGWSNEPGCYEGAPSCSCDTRLNNGVQQYRNCFAAY